MSTKPIHRVVRNRHFWLMVVLCALLFSRPVVMDFFANTLFLAALIASAWVVTEGHRGIRIGLLVFGLLLVVAILTWHEPEELKPGLYGYFVSASIIGLLFYCGWIVLWSLLKARQVGMNEILGTVNLYLVIGFIWAYIYSTLYLFNRQAFDLGDAQFEIGAKLIYFSFVTLTTLGYGDITPQTETAAMMAAVEAIIGQLYVAVIITYLLSIFTAQKTVQRERHSDD